MKQPVAHIHAIGTAVPDHDVHATFIDWAGAQLAGTREQKLFRRMATRSGISHRWSVLPSPVSPEDLATQPTSARMRIYADQAPELALKAIAALAERTPLDGITHLVVASCTGFTAPGVDQIIAARLGLDESIERTLVGFMGCYAAVSALRVAHHIARAEPDAKVLVVMVELSTLHLQDSAEIEPLLAMLQFADGAAAAIVSSKARGVAIDGFLSATLPDSGDLIRWTIGDTGFAMHLSGEVPARITHALGNATMLPRSDEADAWAVHPGGRSILDAVETGLGLAANALDASRGVLDRYGNMSSATLMFVLAEHMRGRRVENGVALAFGPGVVAEGFRFRSAA
ncbi:MAG: type III polyketide synthase [Sphingomonadaceae bacterium]